jgi:choline dehydrogenase
MSIIKKRNYLLSASILYGALSASQAYSQQSYDYIVVGSGAGGGPLAASLAQAGNSVLLLEAGEDYADDRDYTNIPIVHPIASERAGLSWQYFVQHYSDAQRGPLDSKYCDEQLPCEDITNSAAADKSGIFYPRGATVGGSAAVNAMISVKVHDSDWNHIAEVTGDNSWSAEAMQPYFVEVERNLYKGDADDGHGTEGWLPIEQGILQNLSLTVINSYLSLIKGFSEAVDGSGNLFDLVKFLGTDVNKQGQLADGLYQVPVAVDENSHRGGVRTRIYDTISQGHPLTLQTRSLVTNVIFDDSGDKPQAIGVQYLSGEHLYRADRLVDETAVPSQHSVYANKEVILSAGAFNTPQLLMLSGIGPSDQLAAHGIPLRVDLAGVGRNLQDRYEVPVVIKKHYLFGTPFNFPALLGCNFNLEQPDDCYQQWSDTGRGIYSQPGAVAAGVLSSSAYDLALNPTVSVNPAADPDLFIFGVGGSFKGYYPGYGEDVFETANQFSWVILKGDSQNKGRITLRSNDPRDTPNINFQYFGDPAINEPVGESHRADLDAVVKGIKVAREATLQANNRELFDFYSEVWPGQHIATDEQLREFVINESWGHHASCTAKIGAQDDPMAVLDSRFRVYGTKGLRVVDASVFPQIPGFFPAVAINMLSEKAADIIIEDNL